MHAFHSCCQKILFIFKCPCCVYVLRFLFFMLSHVLTCGGHCSHRSKCKEGVSPFFFQLAKMNVEAQRVERELRDELANSISRAASDADRSRITELEKVEAELRVEVSRHVSQCAGRKVCL